MYPLGSSGTHNLIITDRLLIRLSAIQQNETMTYIRKHSSSPGLVKSWIWIRTYNHHFTPTDKCGPHPSPRRLLVTDGDYHIKPQPIKMQSRGTQPQCSLPYITDFGFESILCVVGIVLLTCFSHHTPGASFSIFDPQPVFFFRVKVFCKHPKIGSWLFNVLPIYIFSLRNYSIYIWYNNN